MKLTFLLIIFFLLSMILQRNPFSVNVFSCCETCLILPKNKVPFAFKNDTLRLHYLLVIIIPHSHRFHLKPVGKFLVPYDCHYNRNYHLFVFCYPLHKGVRAEYSQKNAFRIRRNYHVPSRIAVPTRTHYHNRSYHSNFPDDYRKYHHSNYPDDYRNGHHSDFHSYYDIHFHYCRNSKEVTVKISNSSIFSLFTCFYYLIPLPPKSYNIRLRIYQKVFFCPLVASMRSSFSSSFLVSSCMGAGSLPDI